MSSIICYLLCYPDVYKRLRDELDHAFPYVDADGVPVIETEKLSSLNLLNAVMWVLFLRIRFTALISCTFRSATRRCASSPQYQHHCRELQQEAAVARCWVPACR